jgi:hypothetical protein
MLALQERFDAPHAQIAFVTLDAAFVASRLIVSIESSRPCSSPALIAEMIRLRQGSEIETGMAFVSASQSRSYWNRIAPLLVDSKSHSARAARRCWRDCGL